MFFFKIIIPRYHGMSENKKGDLTWPNKHHHKDKPLSWQGRRLPFHQTQSALPLASSFSSCNVNHHYQSSTICWQQRMRIRWQEKWPDSTEDDAQNEAEDEEPDDDEEADVGGGHLHILLIFFRFRCVFSLVEKSLQCVGSNFPSFIAVLIIITPALFEPSISATHCIPWRTIKIATWNEVGRWNSHLVIDCRRLALLIRSRFWLGHLNRKWNQKIDLVASIENDQMIIWGCKD